MIFISILKLGGETVKVAKQEYSFEFLTVSFELNSNDKDFSPISIESPVISVLGTCFMSLQKIVYDF